MTGNSGNNALNGSTGADSMAAGLGNDTYVVDNVGDTVIEAALRGHRRHGELERELHASRERGDIIVLTGTGTIDATGNALDNTLTGNSSNNVLDGGTGSDTANFSGARADYSIAAGTNGAAVSRSRTLGQPRRTASTPFGTSSSSGFQTSPSMRVLSLPTSRQSRLQIPSLQARVWPGRSPRPCSH